MENKCGECALWQREGSVCRRTKAPMNENDNCSKFQKELLICESCGRPMSGHGIVDYDNRDRLHLICNECCNNSGMCQTCKYGRTCDFETNPSSTPKIIMQNVQKGPYQMQTQVQNPDRIRETCQKNCRCFVQDFGCMKQNSGQCEKWRAIYDDDIVC